MVSALAAAVPAVRVNVADHHMDRKHHPYVLRLAPAHAWAALVASWLDHTAGIRIRGNSRCNYWRSLANATGNARG